MPRPPKKTAEFFPHFANPSRVDAIIDDEYGNEGYAIRYRLLELLSLTENHCYDCNEYGAWKYLTAFLHSDEKTVFKVICTLVELNFIDSDLWAEKKIWCQDFVDNLSELYKKRTNNPPTKEYLLGMDIVSDPEIHHREDSDSIDRNNTKSKKTKVIREKGSYRKFPKNPEKIGDYFESNFPNFSDKMKGE